MIAIEGMKMPKRCAECKLCIRHKTNDYGSYGQCMAANCETVSTLNWSLPPSCPLTEIVTCINCKHWKDSDGVYRRGADAESKCPVNTKAVFEGNFYCALGERK